MMPGRELQPVSPGRCQSRSWPAWLAGWLALFQIGTAGPSPSPLADAAQARDLQAVQTLVREGADLDLTQADGMTPLLWAVYHDDTDVARLLIQAGAEVSATNRYGVAPLSVACLNGNEEVIEALLKAGADANTSLPGGETALMTASRTGKPRPVALLLRHQAVVDARERRGQTALMWAAAEGHTEVVSLLLDHGADLTARLPDSGFTPFLFAVREGQAETVRRCLQAGADVNVSMHPEKRRGKGPREGMSPLLLAVENGHFELALQLVESGADPNDQRSGFTALHALSWVRKPNRGDGPDGDPAPRGSGRIGSLQFVRELVARGAETDTRLQRGRSGRGRLNRKGMTPFMMASVTADVPLMKLLVELGADPLIPNADGSTPLMAAAGLGCMAPTEEAGTEPEALEAVQYLIDLGCDVNAVDKNGETAMHGAAYKNLPRVARLLARNGARIEIWNQENRYGWTPLSIAHGYRVGNFKPSPQTVEALHEVMRAAGVEPPSSPPSAKRLEIY